MRAWTFFLPGVFVALSGSPALADWVNLKGGGTLIGIDLKKKGHQYAFTVETGRVIFLDQSQVLSVVKSPRGEKVDFRGQQVTLRQKITTLQREERKRQKQALKHFHNWATRKKNADQAKKQFLELAADHREHYLGLALSNDRNEKVRVLAAQELATGKSPETTRLLSRAVIRDQKRAVRRASMSSLETRDDPDTGELFLPHLYSPQRQHRARAARNLERFPNRKAVPSLIVNLHAIWADFGRGFMFQGTQRSYIHDYNLVSGGTGFSIVEVADPEIQTLSTGVVLDVKVRKVEAYLYARALTAITDQDFGTDAKKWQKWWKSTEAEKQSP
jgi:hypothetical protein